MIGNTSFRLHLSRELLLQMHPFIAMDDAYQNEDYYREDYYNEEYQNDSVLEKLSHTQEVHSGPGDATKGDGEDEKFSTGCSSFRHVDITDRKITFLGSETSSQGYENESELEHESIPFSVLRMRKLIQKGTRTEPALFQFVDEKEGTTFGKKHFIFFCVVLFCSLIMVVAALVMASLRCFSSCPSGWLSVGKSCYHNFTKPDQWDKGRHVCQSLGADLIVIEEEKEKNFLNYKIHSKQDYFWIGLRHIEGDLWKWVDGTYAPYHYQTNFVMVNLNNTFLYKVGCKFLSRW